MQELEVLRQKLNQLIKAYSTLRSEKEALVQKRKRLENELQQHKEMVTALELELQLKSVAGAATGTDEKEALKQHLDAVIKLIDQNIIKLQ